jgi:glycosyltransferase involved in cell wall biosynthesis
MEIDPASSVSIRAAARHLNRGDIAVINHEFGIFGPDDGIAAVDLAEMLDVPALTVFHSVLPSPTKTQREITRHLSRLTTPVVICEAAAGFLVDAYGIDREDIAVISHGAQWPAQPINTPPRRNLITWGLLGPGKGLERAISAVAQLDLEPHVHYTIVGKTHPNVARNDGFAYRDSLHRLVNDLGVSDRVEFVDRYVDDRELLTLASHADLVLVPYDNSDQVSSGVITDALGLGRPVLATKFPYAQELLGEGAGLAVDHEIDAMSEGIRELLTDPISYRRAARAASLMSADLAWPAVARQYMSLIHDLARVEATA